MSQRHPIISALIYALLSNVILVGPWNFLSGIGGSVGAAARSLRFPLALNGIWTLDFVWNLIRPAELTPAFLAILYVSYAIEWCLLSLLAYRLAARRIPTPQGRRQFAVAFAVSFPVFGIIVVFLLSSVPLTGAAI